jgi:hypothetical protein
MVLSYKDPDAAMYSESWKVDILKSYDINICRCSYDVDDREVTFPTDTNIYHYVKTGRFYYDVVEGNNNTLPRISKYQSRGFEFAGYYDKNNDMIHLLSSNQIIQRRSIEPDDYFLGIEAFII